MTTPMSPRIERITAVVPAAAQGADDAQTVWVATFAGKVTAVSYIADTAITGADTNTRKVSLVNKGADGTGTTEMAAIQFNNTINATAFDEKALTLSSTVANRNFAAGDVLAWVTAKVATGIADPGGTVTITVERT